MVYVLAKGIPNITWELLSTKPSYLADRIGILPDILNTLYIIIYTLILVLPLGVGAAIYLTEYAHNKKVVAVIEYAAETLSGIPSIIYGLVGMLLFSNNMGTSLLAGALTQTSCVHEFPENTMPKRDITLTIRHLQEWTHTEMTVTRQDAAATVLSLIHISEPTRRS